ncbi:MULTISPECIES: addiction module antidote protein [Mesorhizobium]|uniref:Putative addiction module antidote protein n=1 Tax=Mesorhizobium denitrificans TaxID=2294114 RepID=A0A371XFX1_9HYPH|nr:MULTISPECIES: addiction module antidote protein [Mesorhizobium]RFC67934.1 putative addiction module antidote protein [Mesorhizobium denitrificans]
MAESFSTFDPADLLKSDEAIQVFLDDAFETGDATYIANALGVIARAKGMTKLSRETGLAREHLYKSLSAAGNPTLGTMLTVLNALGFQLKSQQKTL